MPQIYRLHFAIYYTVTLGSGKIEEPGTKMLCAPFPTTIFTADILVHALVGFYRPGEERVPTKEHEVITNYKKMIVSKVKNAIVTMTFPQRLYC